MVVNGGNMGRRLPRAIHAQGLIIAALLLPHAQLENRYQYFFHSDLILILM